MRWLMRIVVSECSEATVEVIVELQAGTAVCSDASVEVVVTTLAAVVSSAAASAAVVNVWRRTGIVDDALVCRVISKSQKAPRDFFIGQPSVCHPSIQSSVASACVSRRSRLGWWWWWWWWQLHVLVAALLRIEQRSSRLHAADKTGNSGRGKGDAVDRSRDAFARASVDVVGSDVHLERSTSAAAVVVWQRKIVELSYDDAFFITSGAGSSSSSAVAAAFASAGSAALDELDGVLRHQVHLAVRHGGVAVAALSSLLVDEVQVDGFLWKTKFLVAVDYHGVALAGNEAGQEPETVVGALVEVEQEVRVGVARGCLVRVDHVARVLGRHLLGKVTHHRLVPRVLEQEQVRGVERQRAKEGFVLREEYLHEQENADVLVMRDRREEVDDVWRDVVAEIVDDHDAATIKNRASQNDAYTR